MIKRLSVLFVFALFVLTLTSTEVSAASDISGPSIIHKEANQVFTTMDLLSLYELDVFITEDNFTGYGNVPGEYSIVLTQGSKTKHVSVIVVESWGELINSNDVLFVTDYKDIYVSSDRVLTPYEIMYYIYTSTGYVETEYQFRYEEISNAYHNSIDEDSKLVPEGEYEYQFRLTYFTGNQVTNTATIHVVELPELPGVILEAPPTAIDEIMSAVPLIVTVGIIFYLLKHRKSKGGFN